MLTAAAAAKRWTEEDVADWAAAIAYAKKTGALSPDLSLAIDKYLGEIAAWLQKAPR